MAELNNTFTQEVTGLLKEWTSKDLNSLEVSDFWNFFTTWMATITKKYFASKKDMSFIDNLTPSEVVNLITVYITVFYSIAARITKMELDNNENSKLTPTELKSLKAYCASFCIDLLYQVNMIAPAKVILSGMEGGFGIMVKDESDDNDPKIRVIVGGLDPRMLEFLPPEIREAIQKDLGGGNGMPTKQEETPEPEKPKEKIKFDFGMTNCNQDLKDLTEKLKNSKLTNYGILLYGESGSGKSYYGQYLAQELDMPIIKKRASDLIDKWVGATEKNIQAAFKEAREKKAVLLFDEADSFLFDRKYAQRDFECASTNELLTQMEDHPYPFIMTTNLKEKIDKASLRRFLFKIKYDYMNEKNVAAGVKTYFGKQFKLKAEELKELKYLCAGDFKVAKRKMDVLENGEYSNEKIYKYLLAEQKEKDIKTSTPLNI